MLAKLGAVRSIDETLDPDSTQRNNRENKKENKEDLMPDGYEIN
jgi:hypothetical protein